MTTKHAPELKANQEEHDSSDTTNLFIDWLQWLIANMQYFSEIDFHCLGPIMQLF